MSLMFFGIIQYLQTVYSEITSLLSPRLGTIDLGFASVNSQCLGDNKLAIPSYPVNKYILLHTLEHSIRLTMNFSGNKQSFLPSSQPCVIYILLPGAIVVMIVLLLDLQSPVQSVPITTKVVSSNHAHGEVYSIQHYVIKFASGNLRFLASIKLTATI